MTLDFPRSSSAQRSFSGEQCSFRMQPAARTNTPASLLIVSLSCGGRRWGSEGERDRNVHHWDREGEDLPPTQSPLLSLSLSPPPTSITLSLLSVINLAMPAALLTVSFSLLCYATFLHIFLFTWPVLKCPCPLITTKAA